MNAIIINKKEFKHGQTIKIESLNNPFYNASYNCLIGKTGILTKLNDTGSMVWFNFPMYDNPYWFIFYEDMIIIN